MKKVTLQSKIKSIVPQTCYIYHYGKKPYMLQFDCKSCDERLVVPFWAEAWYFCAIAPN